MSAQDQQQHVRQAALALVRPETDAATRTAASQFLEQWTATVEAWTTYCLLLDHLAQEEVGLQLLCLQLLQAKIRREISFDGNHQNAPLLDRLQSSLQNYLQSPQLMPDTITVQPACLCMAALALRRGQLTNILPSLCNSICIDEQAPQKQLRILSSIPLELQSGVSGLAPSFVTNTLAPHVASVLECLSTTIQKCVTSSIPDGKILLYALAATKNWIQEGCITLSQLNAVGGGGGGKNGSLLVCLVQLLSLAGASLPPVSGCSSSERDAIFVQVAQALQETIQVAADSCTETRTAAVAVLLQAMEPSVGFLSAPLQQHGCGEDAAVAVASLASIFVTEEIDELIMLPCESLLHLLLGLQVHPVVGCRSAVLDCWLTVSEVSLQERHEHWRAPLFQQVTTALLQAIEFSEEVDEDDLLDFRRMSCDVFVACYFLLRSEFVQHATNIICGNHPSSKAEAALFALTVTAREANARIKSRTGGSQSLVAKDRQRTAELLLQVVQHIVGTSNSNNNHDKVFLVGVVKFLGAYAASWSVQCSADDILRLLSYLQNTLIHSMQGDNESLAEESAKAIKSVLVSCASVLLQTSSPTPLLDCMRGLMNAALSTNREECMAGVAEGFTRLSTQTKDTTTIGQLLGELVHPVLQKAEVALNALPSFQEFAAHGLSEHAAEAMEFLCCHLRVLQVVIRFSDAAADAESSAIHPISTILGTVSPFLEAVSQRASHFDPVFEKTLSIQQQILKTVPDQAATNFQQTITYVAEVFQSKQHPSCAEFFAISVEAFGSSNANVGPFRDLLSQVSGTVFRVLQQQGIEPNSRLIQSFFEMTQRYILYCPSALVGCPEFAGIAACAVEVLASTKGDRESVRAILNFLTQLFGWRALRLSTESSQYLHTVAHTLDGQLSHHGARTISCCMTTLLGGSQALWPVCTDCIFAITSTTVGWPVPEDPESSVARHWFESACTSASSTSVVTNADVIQTVVSLLLSFAREGPKNKPKAKLLLTDFCMIVRGEKLPDVLVEYTLY